MSLNPTWTEKDFINGIKQAIYFLVQLLHATAEIRSQEMPLITTH